MDPFLLFSPSVDDVAAPVDAAAFASAMQGFEIKALAVALSGGPDSMALLALVSEWAIPRDIRVVALTVDHALRPESATEAQQVHEWVARYFPPVTHKVLRRDVTHITPTKLQEQARHDRYRMMADECHAQGVSHLLLAHHQDDQAETFLFRLCKGSGLDGLAGMQTERALGDIHLIRPLLGFDKMSLMKTCHARDIPFVKDPSNGNDKFARVRLRQVMPLLAQEGLSAKRMSVTAQRLARARAALDQVTDQVWAQALMLTEEGLMFNLSVLQEQPEDIRIRVLMRALTAVSGQDDEYGPRLERVEELAQMLFTESAEGAGFARTTLHHCIIEKSSARATLNIRRENP